METVLFCYMVEK